VGGEVGQYKILSYGEAERFAEQVGGIRAKRNAIPCLS
jgi:hypothetical protein